MKIFEISPDVAVVTSTYVTQDKMPILYVSRDFDEEEGDTWQFHCGNGDYSAEKMQLVKLSTVLNIDQSIGEVADLPVGFCAKRPAVGNPWVYEREAS